MSVGQILEHKGNAVYSVSRDASIRDAIGVLNTHNIGVVLVTDVNGNLAGVLSERDIIRKSLKQETGFRDEPVTKSMTAKVFTVTPGASIDEVMDLMSRHKVRHLPVLDNDKICGLISIGDVVKRKISDAEQEAANLRDYIST